MKKFLCLMMAAVLCMGLILTGCGAPAETPETTPTATPVATPETTADTSLDDVMAAGKLVVGLDIKFPPMGFEDIETGEIVGLDVDLAMAVGEKLGVEIELKPIDWKTKELELDSNKIDVIWNGYTITPAREELVLFSDPYLTNRQIIIVKEGSEIANKEALLDAKIGVQNGSTAVDAIEADDLAEALAPNLTMYEDNTTAMLDLDAGRVDAVVVDEVVGKYFLSMNEGKYTILEENFGDEQYGIGFRMSNVALRNAVQAALAEMKADGTSAEISIKWFGSDEIL